VDHSATDDNALMVEQVYWERAGGILRLLEEVP
jgi:hypothetical protein